MKPIEFLNKNNIYLFYLADEKTFAPIIRIKWRDEIVEMKYTHINQEECQLATMFIESTVETFLQKERRLKIEMIYEKTNKMPFRIS